MISLYPVGTAPKWCWLRHTHSKLRVPIICCLFNIQNYIDITALGLSFFVNGYIFCLHSVSGWLIANHQSSIKLTKSEGYWNMKGQKEKWIWHVSEFGISCYRKRMFWNSWIPKLKSECSGLSAILVKCVSGFCHFKINATIFPLGYGSQILNNTTQMMSSCNC